MEVSLALWREEARQAYDPGAPIVTERIEGLRALQAAGSIQAALVMAKMPTDPNCGA